MQKLSNQKINLEIATHTFWMLQRQWSGVDTSKKFTVADANKLLRQILLAYNTPKALRKQAILLQQEIIDNKRRKQSKATTKTATPKVFPIKHQQ